MSAGEMQDFGRKVLGPAPAMPAKDLSPDLNRGRNPGILNHFKEWIPVCAGIAVRVHLGMGKALFDFGVRA